MTDVREVLAGIDYFGGGIWYSGEEMADQILSALNAAGFAVAPKEPSKEMRLAAVDRRGAHYVVGDPQRVWTNMLAAAPPQGGPR